MGRLKDNLIETLNDKSFFRKAVWIAIPVAVQGLLNTAINMVDTLMIGTLGVTTIAAVGLANKFFFVFTLLVFGIASGSGVLAAQYWGSKDLKNLRKVLGLALCLGLTGSLLFFAAGFLAPHIVMRIFTTSQDAVVVGAAYLAVVCFSYPFTAVTNIYVAMLRAVGRVKAPVVISCITIATNVTFNYIFIFGKLGFPAMGAVGAAIATLIARIIETLIILGIVYIGKTELAARLKEMIGYGREFIQQYISTVSPVIANEFMWGLGVTIYSLVYGRMGNQAVAVITITSTIQDLMIVMFQGLSAATAVVLGNEMGAGHLKRAERYSRNFIVLQCILTVFAAAACVGLRGTIISWYNISDVVARHISICLIAFAVCMPFKMFNYVNVVGILRSGGDTRYCLFLDCAGVWLIGIPLAFLGGLVWKLPVYYVYMLVFSEEIFKFVLGVRRYKQKKWLRNLALELTGTCQQEQRVLE